MLIRIVRMTFQADRVPEFLEIFKQSCSKIRGFEGCQHLELLQDWDNPNIFLTKSHWENAEALERYRQSDLFRSTWAKTKPLFAEKPLAFSSRRFMGADN